MKIKSNTSTESNRKCFPPLNYVLLEEQNAANLKPIQIKLVTSVSQEVLCLSLPVKEINKEF